jgi:hypothetical protein
MFPELIAHLATLVRALGGYSVVCTNATYGHRMEELSDLVDEYSISLKGTSATAEQISGVTGRLAFWLPYQNTLKIARRSNVLELVVVMFEELTADAIIDIYGPLFGRAEIVFKEYRPKVTKANFDHTYDTKLIVLSGDGTGPMSPDKMRALFGELLRRVPEHAPTFRLVMGGGGDQLVATADREHRFVR